MTRWLLVLLICAGCGSANPVDSEPEAPTEISFEGVPVAELDAYITQINRAFGSIDVLFAEYGGITGEATSQLVSKYWSRQFTLTMVERIHALMATLHDIRPENSYLRRLHIEEFEAAFEDYLDGVTYFQQNLDFLTPEILDGLNERMGAGNVHIIRLQIFLSELAGRDVTLGEQNAGPEDGQSVGF